MEDKVKDAVNYLKSKKEYDLILREIKDKYIKTGKIIGKVKLKNLTKEQGLLLSSIDYNLYVNLQGDLSIKKFIEDFTKGRFQGVDFLQVINLYFDGEIKTKKEVLEEKELIKDNFFQEILTAMKDEKSRIWLISALEYKKYGYLIILNAYKSNKEKLREAFIYIDKALSLLSYSKEDYVLLPTFSSNITRDSHYFDMDNLGGKLLISALSYLNKVDKYNTAEKTSELLFNSGIVRDEISNFTITSGLFIYDNKEEIEGYKWFRREKQPLILNLYNLKEIIKVRGKENKVYVFENPAVFYEVLKESKSIKPSLICISGQPNLSSLLLLDKLTSQGSEIYYSGDFDPEGLQIADNLKFRYGNMLKFLGMNKENYLKIKGQNSFCERVGKLDTVTAPELQELKEQMKKYATAGYQELLVQYYIDEINKLHINSK